MANPVMVAKRNAARRQRATRVRPDDTGAYMPGYHAAEHGYIDGYQGRRMAPGSVRDAVYRAAFIRGRAYATSTGASRLWGKDSAT